MRYSLLSRFQGALVGAALGEILGVHCQYLKPKVRKPWVEVDQWGFAPIDQSLLPRGWGHLIMDGIHQLIQTHQWVVEPWTERLLHPGGDRQLPVSPPDSSPVGLAIASLPLSLYFHDDLNQLRYQVERAVIGWCPTADHQSDLVHAALIPAYAIALALQEQLHLPHLLQDLIDDLELPTQYPSAAQTLLQLQTLIQQRAGLVAVSNQFCRHDAAPTTATDGVLRAIAIAFHGFLNTPEEFCLSLLQTARLSSYPQITCALVGALSGVYNSMAGLPWRWRQRLWQAATPSTLPSLWGVGSEEDLLHMADKLMALWSGVYHTSSHLPSRHPLAVAAPNVIRLP